MGCGLEGCPKELGHQWGRCTRSGAGVKPCDSWGATSGAGVVELERAVPRAGAPPGVEVRRDGPELACSAVRQSGKISGKFRAAAPVSHLACSKITFRFINRSRVLVLASKQTDWRAANEKRPHLQGMERRSPFNRLAYLEQVVRDLRLALAIAVADEEAWVRRADLEVMMAEHYGRGSVRRAIAELLRAGELEARCARRPGFPGAPAWHLRLRSLPHEMRK